MKTFYRVITSILLLTGLMGSVAKAEKTDGNMNQPMEIGKNNVTFECYGTKIAGNLFIPKNYEEGNKLPAIIVICPATGVKEQVDKDKIGATGICAVGGYILQTAVGERRIKAVATVSGTLMYKGTVAAAGGEAILQMAGEARQLYDETGEVTYAPPIATPNDESNQFTREAYEYYVGNQDKYPTWKNQIAVFAFANLSTFDIQSLAPSLSPTPVLFIAGTNALTGPLSQNAYDNAKEPKELFWIEGATNVILYNNEEQINQASEKLDRFFKEKSFW